VSNFFSSIQETMFLWHLKKKAKLSHTAVPVGFIRTVDGKTCADTVTSVRIGGGIFNGVESVD
jgi:hypothetical protein